MDAQTAARLDAAALKLLDSSHPVRFKLITDSTRCYLGKLQGFPEGPYVLLTLSKKPCGKLVFNIIEHPKAAEAFLHLGFTIH